MMIHCYKKQIFIIGFLLVLCALVYFSGIAQYVTLERAELYAFGLRVFVHDHYLLSVVLYAAFFITTTILFIPVTLLLTVLAGYLFGIIPGALYATASAIIGGMILFLLVRYLFGQSVQKRFARQVKKFSDEIRERGYSYVLMLQLLPVTPTPLINTVAGLSPLPVWTFVWASFVGMLPSGFIYAFAGQQLAHIRSVNDILSWPMFVLLVALAAAALLIPYALCYMGLTKR